MHSASSLFIYVLSENNGVSLLYLWIESTGSPRKILKLGYKFGFINDRYIIRTHTSLRMACVLCCCINLCTIAGIGFDYDVFSGFVQLVRGVSGEKNV